MGGTRRVEAAVKTKIEAMKAAPSNGMKLREAAAQNTEDGKSTEAAAAPRSLHDQTVTASRSASGNRDDLSGKTDPTET